MYTVPNIKLQKVFEEIVYQVENFKKTKEKAKTLNTIFVNINGAIMEFILPSRIQQNVYLNKTPRNTHR